MDTQKIAAQFRLSGWGEAVKERLASGQSIAAFCNEQGISKNTYYYRQKKVREAACAAMLLPQKPETSLVPNGWAQLAEVQPAPAQGGSLTVEIGGCRIEVSDGIDPALLAKVCGVLKSIC